MTSRIKMTAKNAFWSYFSMLVSLVLQFISRTVFIYYLGEGYLGINGLFSNILGVLSFAELGIGTAINFSLYKPVAEKDIKKIKAYMHYYKWAYRMIAGAIAVLGLMLAPFLDLLIKNPGNVGNVHIYYFIYLFNTVTSYLVSYKYSLVTEKLYLYECKFAYFFFNNYFANHYNRHLEEFFSIFVCDGYIWNISENFYKYLFQQTISIFKGKKYRETYQGRKTPFNIQD